MRREGSQLPDYSCYTSHPDHTSSCISPIVHTMSTVCNDLTADGKILRSNAYAYRVFLTSAEKEDLLVQIQALPGCSWYSRGTHLKWCNARERERELEWRNHIRVQRACVKRCVTIPTPRWMSSWCGPRKSEYPLPKLASSLGNCMVRQWW
ncbi:hypothetical protein C8Q80DRAFT_509739 [Daedaleopsis nitida]|nr:hypothetical protein C8Q80DRAFT_509739 [Daedaleopsis nitida]